MSLEMSDSIENKDMVEKVLIDTEKYLEPEPAATECCIYRVPLKIRRMRAVDYTPQLTSIGPLHHGKVELADMENKKKRYMKYFLDRTSNKKVLDEISTFIKNNVQRIRHSYAEISELNSLDYRLMILYDAIFIIELLLRNHDGDRSDLLLVMYAQVSTLCSDLQLAENQLPYFVLDGIYQIYLDMAVSDLPTFMELCCSFFRFLDYRLNPLAPGETVKHFTDWRRSTILKGHPEEEPLEWIVDAPCATKLHESGVKFKSVERECLLEVKFEKRKQGIPCFNLHELQIPHFIVTPMTERLLRNILAFEQCHYPSDTRFCCYIIFLDYLIDTEKDVDLLVGEGIISNHLGNNAVVANLFNNVCRMMTIRKSSYYPNICKELRKHYNNPWNRAKATLRRVYFHNIWRGTATVAAVLLLILTVTQTIFSILQVV